MATHKYPTSIRLSTHLKRRLQAQAKKLGHNLATLIVFWLEQRLQMEELEQGLPKDKGEEK